MATEYFKCECGGCIVTVETLFRMKPADGSDGPGSMRCPECNGTYHGFHSCDAPATNEVWVDRMEDLMVHAQGEDERGEA